MASNGNKTGDGCGHLVAINLDESSIRRSTPDIDHERAIAIYDLIEDNRFEPEGRHGGEYALGLSIQEQRLVMDITTPDGAPGAVCRSTSTGVGGVSIRSEKTSVQ